MSEQERQRDRTITTTPMDVSPLWILTQSLATAHQALLATITKNLYTSYVPLACPWEDTLLLRFTVH